MEFRVAVVTPYYKEPLETLRQCHESVRAGRHIEVVHYMVADGHAKPEIDAWPVKHVRLPEAHGDNGNTPRSVGSALADAAGFDFIAYLDADNWYRPGHIDSLVETFETTGAAVSCSKRTYHRLDGSELEVTETHEDLGYHVDTSCLLLHRQAFGDCRIWHRMPRPLSPLCDRVFYRALRHKRYSIAHSGERTVAFSTQYKGHYKALNEEPPAGADKDYDSLRPSLDYLYSAAGIRETVATLGFWPGAGLKEELLYIRDHIKPA